MQNKNLIWFLGSFIIFPTVSMSVGSIQKSFPAPAINTVPSQTVLSQKNNGEVNNLLALLRPGELAINRLAEEKNQILEAQAQAIDAYFEIYNMPLQGMGRKMAEEAEKHSLDWRLLPAIAVRESTGGKFACKRVSNNPFGWGSCKINFESNEKAIEVVAMNLAGLNPKTARYYAGKDLKGILHSYNPPHVVPRYAEQVISIMDAIGEVDIATTLAFANT